MALDNETLVKLHRAGFDEGTILIKMEREPAEYDLSPQGVAFLEEAGLPLTIMEKARELAPVPLPESYFSVPDLGIEMVKVAPGEFWMGSPKSEKGRDSDERRHRVTLTRDYWLGKYEVTQGQWTGLVGSNPSFFSDGPGLPG